MKKLTKLCLVTVIPCLFLGGQIASAESPVPEALKAQICTKGNLCRAGEGMIMSTSKNLFSICQIACEGYSDFDNASSVSKAAAKHEFDKATGKYASGETPKEHIMRQFKKVGNKSELANQFCSGPVSGALAFAKISPAICKSVTEQVVTDEETPVTE